MIKSGWITADLTKSDLRHFRKRLKNTYLKMIILKEQITLPGKKKIGI